MKLCTRQHFLRWSGKRFMRVNLIDVAAQYRELGRLPGRADFRRNLLYNVSTDVPLRTGHSIIRTYIISQPV